jgi:ribonucleoside-diphosphate reductase alpha chain
MVHHPFGDFALFVGELSPKKGRAQPVRGLGQRRRAAARPGRAGQDPVDGPARQRPAWLQLKLDALATVAEERAFEMPFPPTARSACSPAWWRPPPP